VAFSSSGTQTRWEREVKDDKWDPAAIRRECCEECEAKARLFFCTSRRSDLSYDVCKIGTNVRNTLSYGKIVEAILKHKCWPSVTVAKYPRYV